MEPLGTLLAHPQHQQTHGDMRAMASSMAPSMAPSSMAEGGAREHRGGGWSPYCNNGGTTMGICGDNYAVLGADTRMSLGYSILTRNSTKGVQLTDQCVLVSSGMQADINQLHSHLRARLTWYEHQNGKQMSATAVAQLLGNTLYYRRFFPYYTFNVLGGVDAAGKGCVWSYDAVGSHERCQYSSSGTGQMLVQPFLDNQVGRKNNALADGPAQLDDNEAVQLVKEAFASAGERDIYTGDAAEIWVVRKNGVEKQVFELKKD